MKSFLLSVVFFSAVISSVSAHPQSPITRYIQSSDTVCVAQVTSISNGVATFSVKEIIKGVPSPTLILRVAWERTPMTQNSEWLLASTRAKEDTVGWAIKGDYGWVNAPVERVEGKIHLVGYYSYEDKDLAANPSKGLTLEQLKELAKTPLPVH